MTGGAFRGWGLAVLLLGLTAACAPIPHAGGQVFPQRLRALGTEPFWSLAIDGDAIRYSTPDDPAGRAGQVTRVSEDGTLTLTGRLGQSAIAARLRRESCSDGMSDRTYAYTVQIELAGQRLNGCAE